MMAINEQALSYGQIKNPLNLEIRAGSCLNQQ